MQRAIKILGVGFDSDEQIRLTQTPNSEIVMGSPETHELLSSSALQIEQYLDEHDCELKDFSCAELQEILENALG